MAGIVLTIEVDDKGTVKVKQFSDETKKAFDEMKKGPQQATGSLNSFRDSWIGVTAKIGIATAAIYAAKRLFYDTAKEIASAGNEIERMARNLNMSTDDFQRWSYVLNLADVNIQEFGGAFAFLTRSMSEALQGSGDANRAFNTLGISLKDTTGKTKDQQTVLMETIGALEKYADGVNRDALMLAIFGRSFMSIKPLIDQGTKAIQQNKDEAERLSLILGKDVIKSLSESEEGFKKFGMTMKVARIEFLEPFVKDIRNLTEELLGLKRAWTEGGITGIWKELREQSEKYKIEALTAPAWVKEWAAGYKPLEIKKPEAPAPSGKKEVDAIKDVTAAIESMNAAMEEAGQIAIARAELAERGWSKEKDIVAQVREELERLERETNEWGEITVGRQELVEQGWKKTAEAQSAWTSLIENISSAWNFNVTGILRGTEKIGDAFKNMVTGMADAFISAVTKMIMEWLLFESIAGGKKKFLGGGSGIGSIVGWIGGLVGLQEGGIFTRPTAAVVGDVPEAVIPLKNGKIPLEGGGGNTIHNHFYNINAVDAPSFVDLCRRNPGGILSAIGEDAKGAGMMRNIIKGTS